MLQQAPEHIRGQLAEFLISEDLHTDMDVSKMCKDRAGRDMLRERAGKLSAGAWTFLREHMLPEEPLLQLQDQQRPVSYHPPRASSGVVSRTIPCVGEGVAVV